MRHAIPRIAHGVLDLRPPPLLAMLVVVPAILELALDVDPLPPAIAERRLGTITIRGPVELEAAVGAHVRTALERIAPERLLTHPVGRRVDLGARPREV